MHLQRLGIEFEDFASLCFGEQQVRKGIQLACVRMDCYLLENKGKRKSNLKCFISRSFLFHSNKEGKIYDCLLR